MPVIKKISIVLFITSIGSLISLFTAAQPAGTHVYKTIDGADLKLDIYKPAVTGKANPAVILFHGGGLVTGRREQMEDQCIFFQKRGITAITADYRLIPKGYSGAENLVINCIKDAKSAVRWVKGHAAALGIDTNLIFLGGGSAGGFLAAEAALNDDINEASDNLSISTKAKALILYNPAFKPETRYAPPPIQYISKESPPAVLFYGDQDKHKAGGDKFYKRLQEENVRSELWAAKGEGHSFFNKPGWNTAVNKKAYNFLVNSRLIEGKIEIDDARFQLHKEIQHSSNQRRK